jgi:tRNA dimethylallyltransferase
MKAKRVIVVAGPTAVGKTAVSIQLAKKLNCDIINADSRQFYKELSIGTAKPSQEEMDGVQHYFIDSHSIHEPLTAGQFEKEAYPILNSCLDKDNCVIVTGGSGLFIQALVEGTHQLPTDNAIRAKLTGTLEKNGLETLQQELKILDPDAFENIDISNPARVIRALELNTLTGKTLNDLKRTKKPRKQDFIVDYFVLQLPREVLYQRINDRVIQMVEHGLLIEAENVLPYKHLQSLNTVGYKELFPYFEGKITLSDAIAQIQQNTRRYAKRQLTWFRRVKDVKWLAPADAVETIYREMCG